MGFLENRDFSEVSLIPEYYKGKTIFITGGSGFMGKVLIEKLLYSCSDLDRIYLLLRDKKGVKSQDRITQLYSIPCFDRLRKELPDVFQSKVCIVSGDVMEPQLGLSKENRELLTKTVNVVFHVAASVRFDDDLTYAVRMNLKGTIQVMDLALEMKNLSTLVHVSTSYSNTNRNPIEEVMYPPHADWRDILRICEDLDEHTIRTLTPKILGEMPNTYTFTKQLAEHVVYEHRGRLPVVIFRPSIVISSVEEPIKGWIENFNGPVALLVASGKGILRSFYTDPDLKADYIPVDISIKGMIAAGWVRGTKSLSPTDDIPIYNCCSGQLNNITMGELIDLGRELIATVPLDDMLWSAGGSLTSSSTLHYFKTIFLHLLPAMFVDLILWLLDRKPMLVRIQRRIYIANLALKFYVTQQWTFDNTNFISLRSSVKKQDKGQFYYEIEKVDRREFFLNSCIGGKRYLLKEKDEDLPKARAHFKRMKVIDVVVRCVFYGFLMWWVVNTRCAQSVMHSVIGY